MKNCPRCLKPGKFIGTEIRDSRRGQISICLACWDEEAMVDSGIGFSPCVWEREDRLQKALDARGSS